MRLLKRTSIGAVILGISFFIGFGISYLSYKPEPAEIEDEYEEEEVAEAGSGTIKGGFKLSGDKKWLSTTEGKTWDNKRWTKKVQEYKSKSSQISLESYVPQDNDDENIKNMKNACSLLLNANLSDQDIENKKLQAEEWCSTKRTVREKLGKRTKGRFLSFKENDNKDQEIWNKKAQSYKTSEKKFTGLNFESEESEENLVKKLKRGCKKIRDAEGENASVDLFKQWCMKEEETTGA